LVCRRIGPVCSKMPRGPARCVLRRVVGRLLRRAAEKRDEALLSASRRNSATGPGREAAGPWGAREAERHCRLPRELQRAQGIGLLRIQGSRNLKRRFHLDCVADGDVALGSRDCGQSCVSQLKLSVVQAKELIADDRARCMRSRRQRFPTVRTVARIGNSEV